MNHYERLAVLREALRAVQEASDIAHALGRENPQKNAEFTGACKECFAHTLGYLDGLVRMEQKNEKD